MPFTLTMPKLSPTMNEGTLVKWHKKEGDFVEPGELLFEVSTDKATVEYQSIDSGWLKKIMIPDGKAAVVNQPVAIFTEEKDESIEGYKPEGTIPEEKVKVKEIVEESKVEEGKPEESKVALKQPAFLPEPPLSKYEFEFPAEKLESRIAASPLAKKLAREKGLDLSTVKGSGPRGRIVSKDLEKAQQAGDVTFGHREVPKLAPGTFEELEISPVRKVIGQRLQQSKSFIPHFYLSIKVDAERLSAFKDQFKEAEMKISVNDLIVKATALSLKKHPDINTGYNSVNQTIIQFKTIDIAIAVSVDGGLITPIVRHADFKSVGDLSLEIRALAQKARDGKLQPQEFKGGSFTLSNLGMFGISQFQAIINPPQAAILAVSAIQEVPVIKNGVVVPGKIMDLTLSVDHRVVDGVAAARFLQTLKYFIENPVLLMVR